MQVCSDWRWSLCAIGVALGPLGFLADPCWRFVGHAPGPKHCLKAGTVRARAPTPQRRPSKRIGSRRGPRGSRAPGPRWPKSEAPNAAAEARRCAPAAPAFVPGLVRPEVIYVETLMASEDVFLVNRDSNLEEVARWIRNGGHALVVDHWRDLERCRAAVLKPLKKAAASAKEAERQRTLKKQLSDRLLGQVAEGRIALQGAPRADFLRTLYGDLFSDGHRFALPSGVLMGLANAWQYFEGGVRFPFLAPPVLAGPVRPFYGVYAYPHPVTHFDMLIEWLRNSSDSRTLQSALDVGTGCGVVALMLRQIAGIPDVVATDVSPNAVYGAREELKRQGLDDVEVLCSDLFTGMDRKFDLVVFNPPWLPLPQATANEPPRTVLDLGNFYSPDLFRRFFDGLPRVLNSDGRAVLLFSNHAEIRGYVDQHPFKAVMDCGDLRVEKVLSRDFDVEGRRRRTGRPQVKPSLEPAAELWELRLKGN
ncbi:prmC [Symbiodinium sp. CCMP2456]|nr:prmC [Symbiodinium sp. CCMP2456]